MKRNLFQRLSACCVRRGALSALLAGSLLAACSDDPADGGLGRTFAEGEHPVVLTAAVEKATRATADDTWSGGEQVAVEAVSNTADAQAEVKTYTADGDGLLTSDAPFWWTNSAAKKTLRAWYCGDGSTAVGEANASAVPTAWIVAADQSSEGYQSSDLLFAPATAVEFAGDAAVPLRFYHQTAKVVVNIRKAEAVTDAALLKAVRIGDGDLMLAADFTAPTDGATAGTWTTDGAAADGTVTPRKLDAPTKPEYVASYEALVIPQPTAKKRMVAVETDFGTMYYTAPDDAAPLAAGKVRTYNITVYADRLEVSVSNAGGAWTAGDSEEVTSKYLVASYTADELKIGDYFYSDGTTSDGGLRERWSDGSLKMEDPKPAPETGDGKTVVGIVFQTDPSRIGEAEKTALAAKGVTAHGLVMSVKNAKANLHETWGPYDTDEGLTKCESKADNYNDISGYGNCEHIRTSRGSFDSYSAFKAADDYNKTCPISAPTTGWYLPASGQWWDILQNLGGCPALADKSEQTSPNTGDFNWSGQGDVPANLNRWMALIAEENKNTFNIGNFFWSSSEYFRRGWCWCMYSLGDVYCNSNNKSEDNDVRPVLAF